jgi:hypothetical protein
MREMNESIRNLGWEPAAFRRGEERSRGCVSITIPNETYRAFNKLTGAERQRQRDRDREAER